MHTFADSLRQENAMRATRRRIAVVLICVASAFTCDSEFGNTWRSLRVATSHTATAPFVSPFAG